MPIPKTRNVGSTMRFLKRDKPGMPHKQKVAISLNTARRAGASLASKAKNFKKKKKKVKAKALPTFIGG